MPTETILIFRRIAAFNFGTVRLYRSMDKRRPSQQHLSAGI